METWLARRAAVASWRWSEVCDVGVLAEDVARRLVIRRQQSRRRCVASLRTHGLQVASCTDCSRGHPPVWPRRAGSEYLREGDVGCDAGASDDGREMDGPGGLGE